MITELRAEVLVGQVSEHAEGPVWSPGDQALLWVDQSRGTVMRAPMADPSTAPVLAEVGGPIGAVVPSTTGGWAVAANDGFALLSQDGRLDPIVSVLPHDDVRRRMNDGKCDAEGAFWAGSMAFDKTPHAGTLYRLRGGEVRAVLTGLTISNGLAWSDDGRSLFFIDTPTQQVSRFAIDASGEPVDPVAVVGIDPAVGAPDGMCIDSEGTLWVAVWGAGAVHRYAPTGELLQRVLVDAPQVSSCCFGGPDLRTLFITTSREGYRDEDVALHPDAGRIFGVRTDTAGPLAAAYAPGGAG